MGEGRSGIILLAIAAVVLAASSGPAGANATEADAIEANTTEATSTLSLGTYTSRGDYGEAVDTSVYYLPVSLEHAVSGWRVRMTAPYLRIDGPGSVLVNVGGVSRPDAPIDDTDEERVSSRGVGDVVVNVTRELPALNDWMPFIDLGVEIKLPTADASLGLGTGATDIAVQTDLYQMIGRSTAFATLGYRFRGRSEWFEGLQDSVYLSAGFMRPWQTETGTGEWTLGVIYDYRQAASTLSRETRELLPFVSWAPQPTLSVMVYVARGFTRDSPDNAVGVQLGFRL